MTPITDELPSLTDQRIAAELLESARVGANRDVLCLVAQFTIDDVRVRERVMFALAHENTVSGLHANQYAVTH